MVIAAKVLCLAFFYSFIDRLPSFPGLNRIIIVINRFG